MNKCIDCGVDIKVLAKRCLKCANIAHLNRSKEYAKRKTPKKKICDSCKEEYQPRIKNQIFCTAKCKEVLEIKQKNDQWTERIGPPVPRPGKNKICRQIENKGGN